VALLPDRHGRSNRKLDRKHVQTKEVEGRALDYIEGWFAISQANAIFGFDGWDREMTHFERVYERKQDNRISCAYVARVRIRVRAARW
jgi:recombination DNA repair RAD52 pathway protein